MLRNLKHTNIVRLIDIYAKLEDENEKTIVDRWYPLIEEEPMVWTYEDGREEETEVKVVKWYLIFEFCPCTLQTLLEQSEGHKLPLYQSHR